jgi:hypothetical protein
MKKETPTFHDYQCYGRPSALGEASLPFLHDSTRTNLLFSSEHSND